MSLDSLAHEWDLLGQDDPMWRVASVPGKRGKWTPEEFFADGRAQVASLLAKIDPPKGEALDFGCGVGRLTQALAPRFTSVVGVDISESMLREAAHLHPPANVRFVHNAAATLPFDAGRFAFVLTHITLQHMPRRLALGYIREFVRVLAPGGIAVFQVPSKWVWRNAGLRGSIEHCIPVRLLMAYHHVRYPHVGFSWVWGVPEPQVEAALTGTEVLRRDRTGPARGWVSTTFFARKKGTGSS